MPDPVGPPGLQSAIGPLLVGLLLSVALQGILVAQTYHYWKSYGNKDSRIFRILIFGLCALELFHTAVSAHAGYWYLISNYGRPETTHHLIWSILSELALTVVITFLGRAFWIKWLFILSQRNMWLTLITSLFSLGQLALGIGIVYEGARSPHFTSFVSRKFAIVAQMLSADLGDLIISLSLCYYLHTSHSGFRSTDLLIDRLIMFVVTRGILACGTGFIQLIAFLIWPDTFIFGVFHLMVSKLYTNALLATLNSREYISRSPRGHTLSEGDTGPSFVLSSFANDGELRRAFETTSQLETRTTQPVDHVSSCRQPEEGSISLPWPPSSSSTSIPGTSSKARYDGTSNLAVDAGLDDQKASGPHNTPLEYIPSDDEKKRKENEFEQTDGLDDT